MVVVGVLQFSHEPGLRTCTDPALAAFSRLPMVDTYRLNGSSGCVIAFNV